jgi:hypothetical protein
VYFLLFSKPNISTATLNNRCAPDFSNPIRLKLSPEQCNLPKAVIYLQGMGCPKIFGLKEKKKEKKQEE